jgi:hypothetical protein
MSNLNDFMPKVDTLLDYSETGINIGVLSSSYTLDLSIANYFEGTTGAVNAVFTLPDAPTYPDARSFTVVVKQGATPRLVTFSGGGGIKWLSGTIDAKATAAKITLWTFFYSWTAGAWVSTGAIQEP